MKEKLRQIQEDFRGVSKGAIALVCYIEGFIIFALVALLIIYGFTTSLTEKAVSQAIDIKDTVIEERDNERSRAETYRLRYEALQEQYQEDKEAHPEN